MDIRKLLAVPQKKMRMDPAILASGECSESEHKTQDGPRPSFHLSDDLPEGVVNHKQDFEQSPTLLSQVGAAGLLL